MSEPQALPAVDAIIATKDRRELLLKALEGILGQDYGGRHPRHGRVRQRAG